MSERLLFIPLLCKGSGTEIVWKMVSNEPHEPDTLKSPCLSILTQITTELAQPMWYSVR